MSKKAIILKIVGRIVCGIMFVLSIFLVITAMTFSFGENSAAPELFGHNIYIVKNGSFDQLKESTAAIAEKVNPDDIFGGDIVIYKEFDNNKTHLAKVKSTALKEAVFSYELLTENGNETTISQGQIVAKVVEYSDFWGAIISFAMAPVGVFAIAILPCLGILIFELVKFIYSKLPQPEVEPVKKQEEIPTYVPLETTKKARETALREKPKVQAKIKQEHVLSSANLTKKQEKIDAVLEQKKLVKSVSNVKDSVSFSDNAKKHLEAELVQQSKPVKADKQPPKITVAPATISADSANSAKATSGSAPDLSDVFRDESDKRYNIDDILAGIEKKHSNNH